MRWELSSLTMTLPVRKSSHQNQAFTASPFELARHFRKLVRLIFFALSLETKSELQNSTTKIFVLSSLD